MIFFRKKKSKSSPTSPKETAADRRHRRAIAAQIGKPDATWQEISAYYKKRK